MSKSYISRELRERVRRQAQYRCGYCLTSEVLIGAYMQIDHIVPESLGGSNEESNLWLACSTCNAHKSNRQAALDPVTQELAPLFNPREQNWDEHFCWVENGEQIMGLTPTGRATVVALKLNRPMLVQARRRWIKAGWHPPRS